MGTQNVFGPLLGSDCGRLGEAGLLYGTSSFMILAWIRSGWLVQGGLDDVEGLLKTVDVFHNSNFEIYSHLRVKF
jgi:hypothetical protein